MFLVAEKEDFRCCRFSPPLLVISKGYGFTAHGISYNNSDLDHRRLKQQLDENFKITCRSVQKCFGEEEREKIMAIAKLFRLHGNVKNISNL